MEETNNATQEEQMRSCFGAQGAVSLYVLCSKCQTHRQRRVILGLLVSGCNITQTNKSVSEKPWRGRCSAEIFS
ncbi:hypothetical protein PFLUV_G00211870 [Perca fluviatilis]|uniref:Uncharacterized protein n=1 Tax=Perca fluviatilis TaxID=8168 RepID=A0A6A5EKN0_PERFL|nr:hypothetical protein PFLUV_G00211870 [Perca fluviatilis]